MTFNNIDNIKGLFALLDNYSYSKYLESERSTLSPEMVATIKRGGIRSATSLLLNRVNDNVDDRKEIIRALGLEVTPGHPAVIDSADIYRVLLNDPESRQDLIFALQKIQKLHISAGAKQALSDLLILLDFVSQKNTFVYGKSIDVDYAKEFNTKGTLSAANKMISDLTLADKLKLKELFGIRGEVTTDSLLDKALPIASEEFDLDQAYKKIDAINNPLSTIKSFALLQQRPEDIPALVASPYELVIINQTRSLQSEETYRSSLDVGKLHASGKKVSCYLSIGAAEDFRSYWDSSWGSAKPKFIIGPDPNGWRGSYVVKFWDKDWKSIVFKYLDKILEDGFDGITLDCVDFFNLDMVKAAAIRDHVNVDQEISKFIAEISSYAKSKNPEFSVIMLNAEKLIDMPDVVDSVDAISAESVWYTWQSIYIGANIVGDIPRAPASTLSRVAKLKEWKNEGKEVFIIDYAQDPGHIAYIKEEAQKNGFIPFVSTKNLRTLPTTNR